MPRLISTKEPAEIREHFLRISDDHPRREMDFRIVTKSGEERWISHACQAIYDENGMFIGRRGSNRDVTERKHAELTSQAMLEALHGSPVTVVITDSKGNIEYANPMFEESSGYAVADVIGKNPRILKSGHHPEEFYARMWATLNSGASWTGEFLNKRRDGELYWEHASIIPVRDESGATVKFVAIKQDITAQKTKEASLYRQASFDALTGLPNRTLFGDRLQHALKKLVRHHEPFALMMIDLDYFKQVNDTFGHAAGDDLLKQATQRMMACLRDSDTLARIGGDEFIVLIDSLVDSNAPDAVASRLNTELARPFTIFGHEVRISGSIGIAIASQPGLTEETLIKQADIALYQAKTQGRNRTMAYQTDQSPELTNPAP